MSKKIRGAGVVRWMAEDGVGIEETIITYQIGDSGTVVPTGTWLKSPPNPVPGKYLWTKIYLLFTDGTSTVSYSVSYYAKDGEDGTAGPSPVRKKWVEGDTHHRNEQVADHIYIERGTREDSEWVMLKENGSKLAGPPPLATLTDAQLESIGYIRLKSYTTVAADVFVANESNIAGLIAKDYKLWSQLGMVGNQEKDYAGQADFVPFFIIDGETGEIITRRGVFETIEVKDSLLENVSVSGSIRAPFKPVDGINIDLDTGEASSTLKTDNLMLKGGDGWINTLTLDWSTAQSGRRVFVTTSKWKNEESRGAVDILAPSGKYFFENGRSANRLRMQSGQMLELIGYGTDDVFHGWIVFNRDNIRTSKGYGASLRFVAQGNVTHNTNNAPQTALITYDDSSLTVSHSSTGEYTVGFNPKWFDNTEEYIVQVTGYGSPDPGALVVATVGAKTKSSFTVHTFKHNGLHSNGSFMFQIFNMRDWHGSV